MLSDWKNFFEAYPDIPEPKLADAETEAHLSKQTKEEYLEEDDDLEEEYDLEDEAEHMASLSSTQTFSLPGSRNSEHCKSSMLK